MEVQTAARPPSGSGSSSAVYPRWVILEQRCKAKVNDSSCATAVARTSNGLQIQVSLSLQEPPATSVVRVNLPDGVSPKYCTVAAHGGSLLIEVMTKRGYTESTLDYFVYNAGDAAADPPRPPWLLLLPSYCPSESEDSRDPLLCSGPVNRRLRTNYTGILCRRRWGKDDDEVVVAELKIMDKDDTPRTEVELLLFSSGEWSVKRPRMYSDDELGELPSQWNWNMNITRVFPVGDRILCWADEYNGGGILLCDVLDESSSPWLHYVPLPTVPSPCRFGRRVCAMAGGVGSNSTVIRLVNIFPRCCCGGAGVSYCERSHHAYTINTWTLRMDDDGMEWMMDGVVDATELWSQDIYKGLPRVPLECPVVSLYEPHVICFLLCENHYVKRGDQTIWLLMVDMRRKTIQSVSRHPDWFSGREIMTSNVSYYLNPYQTCSSGDGTSTGQQDNNVTNSMLQSPCKSAAEPAAQASSDEILTAIREIPSYGLANDDMLKVFLILSGDNGCRVRSLLRLPKNLRKDWLLMEIKADDVY